MQLFHLLSAASIRRICVARIRNDPRALRFKYGTPLLPLLWAPTAPPIPELVHRPSIIRQDRSLKTQTFHDASIHLNTYLDIPLWVLSQTVTHAHHTTANLNSCRLLFHLRKPQYFTPPVQSSERYATDYRSSFYSSHANNAKLENL